MEIQISEYDRILDFIFVSAFKELAEYYVSNEDIIVCVPEYFFKFINYFNRKETNSFISNEDINKARIFGLKMQYNHENKITVFCKSMHTHRNTPKFETEINASIIKI